MANLRGVTQEEIDERIEEFKSNANVFRRYKITDPETFYANPLGYDGLEFVSEERGTTWRNIEFSCGGIES
jgi:hypothetical protein